MRKDIFEITASTQEHNTLYSDYKAEILAINLLKYYDKVDHVFLKRLGSNDRSFNKDINQVSSRVEDLDQLTVSISSFREGFYDYLPEGIFHPPSVGDYQTQKDSVILKMQHQKKTEAHARNFFWPFELESFFLEINALTKENEFEITDDSSLLLDLFKELWPLLEALDEGSAKVFSYLLPFFHKVKGNRRWLEKCLQAFLAIPVNISFVPNRVRNIKTASDAISLANFRLGISMVLSGEHMDGERNWAIRYGPIPDSSIAQYVPQSGLRKLLEVMYDHCLPATVEVEEHFVVDKNSSSFCLDKNQDTSRLGYSTFL
ncbi:type VI secretion system baseplate subunit TssG [Sphingobacterium sp. MYb382]|uniref:type VI secretion system baseplate subunit TssG n=1 Tax=Sphingobacterium sp. MYb382 TaxID=2745278 RepID=UPI0030AD0B35